MCGANERRCAQVKRLIGIVVSESTWKRWRRWWCESFITTPFWQQAKGLLPPITHIRSGPFPRVILNIFQGRVEAKIILLLRLLAPLTEGVLRAV